MDEARHVEVYERYIHKLAIVYPMAQGLRALIDKTLSAGSWLKIAIGMNMVIEGLALGAFQNMRRATGCNLLRQILEGVLRDEARHVAFGGTYVAQAVAGLHPDELEDLADFACDVVVSMRGMRGRDGQGGFSPDPGFVQVLGAVGIDPMDFVRGVMEARAAGVKVQPPDDQVHAFRDLMMPALVRAGVVTPRVRDRYTQLGIKIHDDLSVLRSLEGTA
jgi:hypothetical protein